MHEISLPAELCVNECNAEIQVVEKTLSIRSRKLLKRPRLAIAKNDETEHPIQYTSRPDPATYCPLLYAPCDTSSDESSDEEQTGPREMRTSEIGCGDDLTEGISAVDGVRFLSNKVRQHVKDIKYLDLSDGLLSFIDDHRAYLNRRL